MKNMRAWRWAITTVLLAMDLIIAKGSGIVTCSVPMCYRVVAMPIPSGMVLIPNGTNAGTNPLGAGESYSVEYPQTYSLTVNSFYIDKYEVTKTQWDEVYTWAIEHGYSFDDSGYGKGADYPVEIFWYDCMKWCNARSEKEGRPAVYTVNDVIYKTGHADNVVQTSSAAGYRLPTQEEWEYAARGGVANHRFPWEDTDTIQHARASYFSEEGYDYDTSPTREYFPAYQTNGVPYTSPVGSFAPNGYGLYDMAGNVYEWCFDWNPGAEGEHRAFRGGGWNSYASQCRIGFLARPWIRPYINFPIGFRCVLSLGQP